MRERHCDQYRSAWRKPQKSALFQNWHGPCNLVFIRRKGRWDQEGNFEMTTTSNVSQRLFAMVAAFGMTTFMLVASFSAPSAHAVQAMFA
jgi:hypothetical protein